MRSAAWTARHDRLIRLGEPPAGEPTEAEIERIWHKIVPAIAEDRVPRRRRRVRITIAAGVGALFLGTSGLAAGQLYTSHTGKGPADAEDLRLGGPGERLDPAAPDYGAVVAKETADIPFPSVRSRDFAVSDQVHDARFSKPGDERVSVSAVRAWVADAALCAWSNQWAAATRDGADAERDQAIETIQGAPRWPAVVAIDPKPYSRISSQQVTDADGNTREQQLSDDSQFYYLGALGRAVEGRDPEAVARVLAENNGYCRAELVPDLPNANPMRGEQ